MPARVSSKISALSTAAILLAIAGCSEEAAETPSDQQTLTAVKVAIVPVAESAQVFAAMENGFFEDAGLEVTTTPSAAGPDAAAQVVSGQVQFGLGADSVIINARSNQIPLVIAASAAATSEDPAQANSNLVVPADSDVNGFADLTGRTVAVVALENNAPASLSDQIDRAGGDSSQTQFVALPFSEMPSALQSGRVDAIGVNEPFLTQVLSSGVRSLGSYMNGTYGDGVPYVYWYTSDSFAEENPDAVAAFRDALDKAGEFLNENPDEARALIGEFTEIPANLLEEMRLPVFGAPVSEEPLATMAGLMSDLGYVENSVQTSELMVPEE